MCALYVLCVLCVLYVCTCVCMHVHIHTCTQSAHVHTHVKFSPYNLSAERLNSCKAQAFDT